eukprot:87336-Pleurochrysis_carterae.AAC.1
MDAATVNAPARSSAATSSLPAAAPSEPFIDAAFPPNASSVGHVAGLDVVPRWIPFDAIWPNATLPPSKEEISRSARSEAAKACAYPQIGLVFTRNHPYANACSYFNSLLEPSLEHNTNP